MEPSDLLPSIAAIIREQTGDATLEVTAKTGADDADGWDSLAHARIIIAIEDKLGINIPDRLLFDLTNVGDLLDVIAALAKESTSDAG